MSEPNTIQYQLPGLEQPAEIVVDRWGIPHIRARTRHDVFFVQGWQAARDRLWQLDIWRKRGLGMLAEDYGPGFVAQDRASRLFLYRGDMEREWAAYGTDEARSITEAFAAGINAWISLTESRPELLAPEFAATGTRPALWEAADVVRVRSHGRTRNVLSEVARAQIMAESDLATDLLRRSIEPQWTPMLPDGVDAAAIPPEVLDVFRLATNRVDFSPERLAAAPADAWRWAKVTDLGDVYRARIEQLDGRRNAHRDRAADPGERSASGTFTSVAAQHRAPDRARDRCDRRGRAGSSRRVAGS